MALKLDEPPQDYDDNQPSWQTNLNGNTDDLESMYNAPDATDADLPPEHPSRAGGVQPMSTDEVGPPDSYSPGELQDAESEVGPSQPGYGVQSEYDRLPGGSESSIPYTPEPNERLRDKAKLLFVGQSRTRKTFGGGILTGGVVGLIISIFTLILPLKLEHFLQNIQQQYFRSSENAISQRAEQLLISYFKTAIIPNMTPGGTCSSTRTITKDCVVTNNSNTPAGRLYQVWRDKRFENILSEKYGITLERGTGGSAAGTRLRIDGLPDVDFDEFADGNQTTARLTRDTYRSRINEALQNETRLKRMYLRFKVGGLLERKYGITRCLIACDTRNKLTGRISEAKRFAKLTVVNRVITPRSDSLGLILTCIIDTSASGCNTDPEVEDPQDEEQRRSALDREIRKFAETAGREVSEEALQKAVTVIDDLNSAGGLGKYIAGKIGTKIAGEAGEKVATSALPVVGWVNLAASLIYKSAEIGKFVKYASYAQHASEAVTIYTTWATFNDEIKEGYGDPALIGSMTGALSYGIGDTPSNQPGEIGSMWTDINNDPPQSSLLNILLPKAYAQAQREKAVYTCNDGEPVPEGKKICDEEDFRIGENPITEVSDFWNGSPQNLLKEAAGAWNAAVSILGKPIELVAGPIMAPLEGVIGEVSGFFTDIIGEKVIKTAVTDTMSGARLVNVLFAGANVSASSSEMALGAPPVSDSAMNQYREYYRQEREAQFASKPLHERLFSTKDANSLVSHVAMRTPTDSRAVNTNSVASLFSNPVGTLGNSFASLFDDKKAYAGVEGEDPFGIPQFAYAPNDEIFKANPDIYTAEYCEGVTEAWNNSFTEDSETGQMIATTQNPCLLESAAVTAAGGFFDSSLIDPKDLGQSESSGSAGVAGNPNITIFGDSLTVGMRDAGGLGTKLQAAGWEPLKIEATSGDTVEKALPKITAARAEVSASSTVVVMLGTNPENGFADKIKQAVDAIRASSPLATIYWMNALTRDNNYDEANATIAAQAQGLNYKVIDWRAEYQANASKYPFADALHHNAAGYNAKADFLVSQLGAPPAAGGIVASGSCAAGTRDVGEVDSYAGGKQTRTKLCAIAGFPSSSSESTAGSTHYINGANGEALVAASASDAWSKLITEMKAAGLNPSANSSFRTMQHQTELCSGNTNCRNGNYSEVAKPGNSNHQAGLAIDFANCNPRSTACFQWLAGNAQRFGVKNYDPEPWHWSTTGN